MCTAFVTHTARFVLHRHIATLGGTDGVPLAFQIAPCKSTFGAASANFDFLSHVLHAHLIAPHQSRLAFEKFSIKLLANYWKGVVHQNQAQEPKCAAASQRGPPSASQAGRPLAPHVFGRATHLSHTDHHSANSSANEESSQFAFQYLTNQHAHNQSKIVIELRGVVLIASQCQAIVCMVNGEAVV
jgi:hypothetical protein